MKYLTGYIYEDCAGNGKHEESLCLVQLQVGTKEAVLACVCDGGAAGAAVTKQLKLWMAQRGTRLVLKSTSMEKILREMKKLCQRLQKEAGTWCNTRQNQGVQEKQRMVQNTEKLNLAGILVVGEQAVLIQNGDGCICMLNRRGNSSHRRFLEIPHGKTEQWGVISAGIEPKVSILLGRATFLKGVGKEEMLSCLYVSDLVREEQIGRRLSELAEERCRKGDSAECSAILIHSLPDEGEEI